MNIDKISLTLYDLLAYLLPGYLLLFACSLIESCWASTNLLALSRWSQNPLPFAVTAYYLGQLGHAFGSWFKRRSPYCAAGLHEEVNERIIHDVSEAFGIELSKAESLSSDEIYLLADSYIVACGGSSERDILTAREGFFKASMAAAAVLGVTLLLTLLTTSRIQIQPKVYSSVSAGAAMTLSLGWALTSWVFWHRYRFFNSIKRHNTLRVFLAMSNKASQK